METRTQDQNHYLKKTNTMGLAYPKICSARERNSLDIVVVFETIYLFIVLLLMQRGTVATFFTVPEWSYSLKRYTTLLVSGPVLLR